MNPLCTSQCDRPFHKGKSDVGTLVPMLRVVLMSRGPSTHTHTTLPGCVSPCGRVFNPVNERLINLCEANSWTELVVTNGPSPRHYVELAWVNDGFYLHGGYDLTSAWATKYVR